MVLLLSELRMKADVIGDFRSSKQVGSFLTAVYSGVIDEHRCVTCIDGFIKPSQIPK